MIIEDREETLERLDELYELLDSDEHGIAKRAQIRGEIEELESDLERFDNDADRFIERYLWR